MESDSRNCCNGVMLEEVTNDEDREIVMRIVQLMGEDDIQVSKGFKI